MKVFQEIGAKMYADQQAAQTAQAHPEQQTPKDDSIIDAEFTKAKVDSLSELEKEFTEISDKVQLLEDENKSQNNLKKEYDLFEKNKLVKELQPFEIGTIAKKSYDANFGAELSYYEKEFFAHKRILVKKPTTVKGELTYMLCDDKRCLPPKTIPFEIAVKPSELKKPN
jgi:hypothetical protein